MKEEYLSAESSYTGDERSEVFRITRQNEYLNIIVKKYLDDIFTNYESPSILDVGCSDGTNILLRLQGRKYHSLLGIDKNQKKIAIANKLHKTEKDSFMFCDINTGQLSSILKDYLNNKKLTGFDIIHISSVLLHVEKPGTILRTLKKYLSTNGCVFIQDEDDGANFVYPFDKSFEDCFYIWDHSIESGDRHMGRKIPYILNKEGYSEIKILSTSISSTDFNGGMKDCLWDIYFNSDLWVADDESFYDNSDAYKRFLAYKARHSELREKFMDGNYFIMLGVFFITAK